MAGFFKRLILVSAVLAVSGVAPAMAQTMVRDVAISDADLGRVQAQCDALRSRELRSLAADDGEPPAAGVIVSDPASVWADGANAMDSAVSRLNLDALTLRDCREAGL